VNPLHVLEAPFKGLEGKLADLARDIERRVEVMLLRKASSKALEELLALDPDGAPNYQTALDALK
jgi:hypothetical protein